MALLCSVYVVVDVVVFRFSVFICSYIYIYAMWRDTQCTMHVQYAHIDTHTQCEWEPFIDWILCRWYANCKSPNTNNRGMALWFERTKTWSRKRERALAISIFIVVLRNSCSGAGVHSILCENASPSSPLDICLFTLLFEPYDPSMCLRLFRNIRKWNGSIFWVFLWFALTLDVLLT